MDVFSTPNLLVFFYRKIAHRCPFAEIQVLESSPDSELQFEVQVVRVSGMPSEAESRKDDVLHRYSTKHSLLLTVFIN